jgi:thiamine pyrophosphokinase
MKIALVCYCGDPQNIAVEIKQMILNCDVIIAVDSGLDFLSGINLLADYAVGDFDSLKNYTLLASHVKNEVIKLARQKDETDLRAAINFALEKFVDINEIIIFTHFSGRIDQQIGVITQLKYLLSKNLLATIYSDQHILRLLSPGCNILTVHNNHQYYSFISLADITSINSAIGLEYSLNNLALDFFTETGISNRANKNVVQINIKSGLLLSIETFKN